jgi:NADH-quinone oxidoreductase subunit A
MGEISISILTPPIAFAVVLAACGALSLGLGRLSPARTARESEPYACGEDIGAHLLQPDYGQFFPFACFFTILHVVALMLATLPLGETAGFSTMVGIAVVYLLGALAGLVALFRR